MCDRKKCSEITDEKLKNQAKLIDDRNKKCTYKDNVYKQEYKN